LIKKGHQIGCYGLTHGDDENFNKLPYNEQLFRIERATKILEGFVGKVTAFRAPGARISSTTLKILEKSGYIADSSISSQRFDLASSNMNPKLLFAPRMPYHPKESDTFRKGNMKIWEIPISAFMLPFISGTLSVFGLGFMKRFFNVLYKESQRTGKPIVYLIHPTEFLASENYGVPASWFFSPRMWRVQGNPVRYFLFRRDGKVLFDENKELFAYMKTFKGIKFMTVDEYIKIRSNVEVSEKRALHAKW
jgi:peptidoglycan/xylan/chitin deacetylase (PgdA/CDA1 family)